MYGRSSDKLTARRAKERKEQYKQVRAHVKKDDGRLQVDRIFKSYGTEGIIFYSLSNKNRALLGRPPVFSFYFLRIPNPETNSAPAVVIAIKSLLIQYGIVVKSTSTGKNVKIKNVNNSYCNSS